MKQLKFNISFKNLIKIKATVFIGFNRIVFVQTTLRYRHFYVYVLF